MDPEDRKHLPKYCPDHFGIDIIYCRALSMIRGIISTKKENLEIIQEETKDLEWDLMRGSEDAGDEELQAERLESVSIKKQCSGDQSALKYPKSSCAPGSVSILAFCKSPSAQLSYYM